MCGTEAANEMPEKSKTLALLSGKCPQCRTGNLFKSHPYHLKEFTKMHTECPHCGVKFEREPRFFDGAMYVSYAMSVGLFLVSAFLIYHLFNGPAEEVYLIAIILEVILLYPLLFRFSRIIYLYVFGGLKYKAGIGTERNN